MATVFSDHELSLRLAKAGAYQHHQSPGTAVVDRAAVDTNNVTLEKSERTTGEIFNLTPEIERKLLSHDGSKPITFIQTLLDEGLIRSINLRPELLSYLREIAKEDESDVMIVFVKGQNGENYLQSINSYKDGNDDTITRKRGGIVHAMLNRRPEYTENRHFLLPIKNSKGEARLLYKSNVGGSVLQNLKNQKSLI